MERLVCGRRHYCLAIKATDPARCQASGAGLRQGRVGERGRFYIQAADREGKEKTAGGDVFGIMLFHEQGIQSGDCLAGDGIEFKFLN